jgi:hypothetical protein
MVRYSKYGGQRPLRSSFECLRMTPHSGKGGSYQKLKIPCINGNKLGDLTALVTS